MLALQATWSSRQRLFLHAQTGTHPIPRGTCFEQLMYSVPRWAPTTYPFRVKRETERVYSGSTTPDYFVVLCGGGTTGVCLLFFHFRQAANDTRHH